MARGNGSVIEIDGEDVELMARTCAELTRQGIIYVCTLCGKRWRIEMTGGF